MPQPIAAFKVFISDDEIELDDDGEISEDELKGLISQKMVECGFDPSSDIKFCCKPGILVSIVVIASPGEPGHSGFVDPVTKRNRNSLN